MCIPIMVVEQFPCDSSISFSSASPLLFLYTVVTFLKRLIKKRNSEHPCKQAPGSLDSSPITFDCLAGAGCVNRMECDVMNPLLKCTALRQDGPHHPFIFIDLLMCWLLWNNTVQPSIETYNLHGSESGSLLYLLYIIWSVT